MIVYAYSSAYQVEKDIPNKDQARYLKYQPSNLVCVFEKRADNKDRQDNAKKYGHVSPLVGLVYSIVNGFIPLHKWFFWFDSRSVVAFHFYHSTYFAHMRMHLFDLLSAQNQDSRSVEELGVRDRTRLSPTSVASPMARISVDKLRHLLACVAQFFFPALHLTGPRC